jgi:hypothetical protein
MFSSVDGVVEVEGLIAEPLAKLEALANRERPGKLDFLALLFPVDPLPFGLVTRGRE